ncbi:hypothetical protein TWF132_007795 [Orbilia oligospora]|nr:hypothetical protein TWF132_007795 [Orbilia oligospora]
MDSDDILGLLAVAEHINIDFLPFQCDNSNPIGIGGTAKITRGAKTSTNRGDKEYNFGLVFKRTQSEIEYKNRAEVFRAVLSEVYILGHPVVRHHPNISSLQGICWEIIHNEPWPVLIFKQAPYGDLSQFMKSGIELEFKDKIKICWEIGNALQLMHKCSRVERPSDHDRARYAISQQKGTPQFATYASEMVLSLLDSSSGNSRQRSALDGFFGRVLSYEEGSGNQTMRGLHIDTLPRLFGLPEYTAITPIGTIWEIIPLGITGIVQALTSINGSYPAMDSDIPPPGIDEPNQVLLRGPSIPSDPVASDPPPAALSSEVSVDKSTTTSGFERPKATAAGSSGDDIIPQPLQKRRTSSFEYHEDGPSQYDSLKLVSRGPNPISPLFLDLLRGKIREAERQLHFALLSTSTRDSHDASKRCSCALAELDYVRQRVILPPPIQLLDARVLRTTALSTLQYVGVGEDRVLDAKKAENLIERAFQVLGELVDWEEVKKRGAAVEMLEEFLPMCYFGKDAGGKVLPDETTSNDTAEGEEGTIDFTESLVLWYQMMVDHAKITLVKAEIKEGVHGKKIKIENLAKAGRLFAVALEGMKEIYETDGSVDTEYVDYKKSAEDGLQRIADIAVRVWKQDELVEIMESTTPKLDMENIKLKVIKAMQKAQEESQERAKRKEQSKEDGYADRPPKTPANDDGPEEEEDISKSKGKGRATDADEEFTPLSPKPISAKEKGKGKAIILDDDEKEKGLPAYTPCTEIPNSGQKEDDWIIVEPKE